MKSYIFFIVVLIVLGLNSSCSQAEQEEPSAGEIEVRVSDEKSMPVSGVKVQLLKKSDTETVLASEITNSEGKVFFKELKAGLYYVRGNQPEWISGEEKISLLNNQKAKALIQLAKPFEQLTILNYNVLQGFENNEQKKSQFVAWVKKIDPDIICFQELNYFKESALVDFATRYGHPYAVITKESGYPTGISSKYPIRNVDRILDGMTHGYMVAQIKDITIFNIHLSPSSLSARIFEMQTILKRVSALGENDFSFICGDFNSYSKYDSDVYGPNFEADMLARNKNVPVDFTATNLVIDAGYVDSQSIFNSQFKRSLPTEKYLTPGIVGARYDYIYLSGSLTQYCKSSEIIHDEVTHQLSDHYPVLISLSRK